MTDNTNQQMFTDDWAIDIAAPTDSVLEEGDYVYTVSAIRREEFEGDQYGHPAGKRAELTLSVETDEGPVTVRSFLYMHKDFQRKIYNFFVSLGLIERGDPLKLNLTDAMGKRGRGHFSHMKRKDGGVSNFLQNFIDYDERMMPAVPLPEKQISFTEVIPPDDLPF